MAKSFDTAAKTAELVPDVVVVEGRQYRVKRSGKALKRIIELNPADELNVAPTDNLDRLYKGLSFLLVDGDGNNPDPEQLEDELDFEVANILMEKLMPGGDEGNSPNASNQDPSTPT